MELGTSGTFITANTQLWIWLTVFQTRLVSYYPLMSLVWKEYSQVPGSSPDPVDTSRKIFYKMLYLLSSSLGGSPTSPPNIHTHTYPVIFPKESTYAKMSSISSHRTHKEETGGAHHIHQAIATTLLPLFLFSPEDFAWDGFNIFYYLQCMEK